MAPRIAPRLASFARTMRTTPTPIEAKLWKHLRSSQLGGFKFRRQTVLAGYIVDFFCPSLGLCIELDGRTHDDAYDAKRDAALRNEGFEVLRFGNQEVGLNLSGVLQKILITVQERPERWPELPHPPAPSPEGEGE